MASITLNSLNPDMLVRLGDEFLRAGNAEVAKGLFQAAWDASKTTAIAARIGLLEHPLPHTPLMFEALRTIEKVGRHPFVGESLATWGKTVPGMEDPRFREIAQRHAHLLPMANWHWNLGVVAWAVQQVRALPGDFVELGVFRGHTTLFVAELLEFASWPKRWRLYDTFSGIPDDQVDPGWAEKNVAAYRGTFSFEEVRDRFAHIGNIEVIRGRVPDVFEQHPTGPIAFMHLDLNNSSAEIAALDRLYDHIVPGGVIVFDDYCWAVSKAQYDAEKAWFERRGLVILPLPTGQGVFVKPAA
jgi:hypothetical protein